MRRSDRVLQTRAAILEAAASCFAARGFDGASLDEVAAEAGVTKPTIYAHFSSKEGLCEALIQDWWAAFSQQHPLRYASGEDPSAQLLAFARRHLHSSLDARTLGLFRAVCSELIRRPDWAAEVLSKLPEGDLPAWLRAAHAAGALAVPDPKRSAELFFGALKGCLFYPPLLGLSPVAPEPTREAMIEEVVRVFVAGHALRAEASAR